MNTESPVCTITLDIYPDGKVNVWSQKKAVLTREQEELYRDWLRKIEEMKTRVVRQLELSGSGI